MSSPFGPASSDPFQPPQEVAQPRWSRSLVWLFALGAMAGVCCCSGMCIVPSGMGLYQSVTERDDVEAAITQFLVAMDQGRSERALELFSQRAVDSQAVSREQIEKLLDSPYFRGCQSATVQQILISQSFNTNEKVPQGTVAKVSGPVSYRDGSQGTFQATLEKDAGKWKLFSIRVQKEGGAGQADSSTRADD